MEVKLKPVHVLLGWIAVAFILAILSISASEEYADTHKWIVNHSEIKR